MKELLKTTFGLFLFSFGVHLTIHANIGLAPWDCFSMGISYHLPVSYGIAHTCISILLLLIDIGMKEKIGLGTILDAFLVGNFVDFFEWLGFVPVSHDWIVGVCMILAGLSVMAYGQYLYMSAGQGCGPRDSFLVGMGKRLSKVPIGAVQTGIMGVVLLIGFLLGGPIGLGTIITTFGTGTVMQIVFHMLHFEPRKVRHKNAIEAFT